MIFGRNNSTDSVKSSKFLETAFCGTAAPNLRKWETLPKCTSLIKRVAPSSQNKTPDGCMIKILSLIWMYWVFKISFLLDNRDLNLTALLRRVNRQGSCSEACPGGSLLRLIDVYFFEFLLFCLLRRYKQNLKGNANK